MRETDAEHADLEQVLREWGEIVWRTRGGSMRPLIVQGRDLVTVKAADGPLKPLDVALYRAHGQYVLHRVIAVEKDGYRMRGDSNTYTEHVPFGDVLGVMTGLTRAGCEVDLDSTAMRLYARLRVLDYPLRRPLILLRRRAARLARRLGLRGKK